MRVGINVNVRAGLMPDAALIRDRLSTVRMVFDRWNGQRVQTVDETLGFIQPIIDRYREQRVRTILVLNQQSFGDGGWNNGQSQPPWITGGVSWDAYAREFATMCHRVASALGTNVIYQIGNEHDISGGESSISWNPEHYAVVLRQAIVAIRNVQPTATIYSHGHATGAGSVVKYWRDVENAYGGRVPINALAVHPYGQHAGVGIPRISTAWFGRLQDYWRIVSQLGYPLTVTEIGVSEHQGFPPSEWPAIARYMREVYDFLRIAGAQDFVWFAWHDGMRGAGVVDMQSKPKPDIYDTLMGLGRTTLIMGTGYTVEVSAAILREFPTTRGRIMGTVPRGTRLQADAATQAAWQMLAKQMDYRESWYAVRHGNGVAFIRADLVS